MIRITTKIISPRYYRSRLNSKLFHPMAGPGGETTLQQAIVLQARLLAHVIAGRAPGYEGIRAK